MTTASALPVDIRPAAARLFRHGIRRAGP